MNGENWESLITEKGFMRVPRALRLKRAELGITNNEYTILLDYVDYYSFSGTMNPYRHLTEVSGMNERSVRRILTSLENKGLLKRKVNLHGNGRTKGVVFSIAPLVKKLRAVMKKMSPTVGDENVPYVGDISVPPNTGEELNKREDDKNTSAKNADVRARGRDDERVDETGAKEYETEETDFGFIRETGGPDQEAPRNDRREACESGTVPEGGKAGQIHLARAVLGPRGLFSDEDGDGLVYHPHPNPVTGEGALSRESIAEGGFDVIVSDSSLTRNRPSRGREVIVSEPMPSASDKDGRRTKKVQKVEGGNPYSPSRWYNEVWRGLYEEAAGQPALTGRREYQSAETYFGRLRELNPEMSPGEIYELAGEGAAFMIASQLEGGVFGWMHKPPDICMLASQAQSVEWFLRKIRRSMLERDGNPDPGKGREIISEGDGASPVLVRFIEKIREVQDAGQEIDRVYGELRGIESASRGRAVSPGSRALRRKRG